jgi:hypothetical protein
LVYAQAVLVGERFVLQGELRGTPRYSIMRDMKKTLLILAIAVLLTSSVSVICFVKGEMKPYVPEFTVKYSDNSYDYYVPPVSTSSMDPYTGKITASTQPGYTRHVENKSIEITIKNQPLNPPSTKYIYYNVRTKGYYGGEWATLYSTGTFYSGADVVGGSTVGNLPQQSSSEYTILNVRTDYAPGAKLEFQVQAVAASDSPALVGDPDHPLLPLMHWGTVVAINQTSDWSNTQTISIPESSSAPTATPTTPTASQSTMPVSPAQTSLANPEGVSKEEYYTVTAVLAAMIAALFAAVVALAVQARRAKAQDRK